MVFIWKEIIFLKNLNKYFIFVDNEWTKIEALSSWKGDSKCIEVLKNTNQTPVLVESVCWHQSELLLNSWKMVSCLTPIGRCLQALQFLCSRKVWFSYEALQVAKGLYQIILILGWLHVQIQMITYLTMPGFEARRAWRFSLHYPKFITLEICLV